MASGLYLVSFFFLFFMSRRNGVGNRTNWRGRGWRNGRESERKEGRCVLLYILNMYMRNNCTLMRPGIGRNVSCTLGDYLSSRPEGNSWPRLGSQSIHVYLHVCTHTIAEVEYQATLYMIKRHSKQGKATQQH